LIIQKVIIPIISGMWSKRTYIVCIWVFVLLIGIGTAFSYLTWSVDCSVSVETFSDTELQTELEQYRSWETVVLTENLVWIRHRIEIKKHRGYLWVRYHPIPFSWEQDGVLYLLKKNIFEKPNSLSTKTSTPEYFVVTSQENEKNFLSPKYEVRTTMNNRDFKTTACTIK